MGDVFDVKRSYKKEEIKIYGNSCGYQSRTSRSLATKELLIVKHVINGRCDRAVRTKIKLLCQDACGRWLAQSAGLCVNDTPQPIGMYIETTIRHKVGDVVENAVIQCKHRFPLDEYEPV